VVRSAAVGALTAAVAMPLLRRRLAIPAPVTLAAVAAGPVGLAILRPRTKTRDAALFVLQMWAFTVAHELPHDDPARLRRRLRIRYPIVADRLIGGGELPTLRLQRALSGSRAAGWLNRTLAIVHWSWFGEPHAALVWILARRPEGFARAARQLAAAYDLGCVIYFVVPTAPPWWASEEGYLSGPAKRRSGEAEPAEGQAEVRRVMVEVGERVWGRAWPTLYGSLAGNAWAAMPSLHFATSALAAILLAEAAPGAGVAGWGYALTLAFALVYLGEHYVIDVMAGAALVALVRRIEPLVEPLALRISAEVQRLERLANG